VTRRSGMGTSAAGEVALGRRKGGDTSVGLTQILLDQKMKKIHVVDSSTINEQ
jgi:hypothetical protein